MTARDCILPLTMLTGAASADPSDHWAVLVAGSKGFGNYRHQSDTCHAYQILKRNGVPEDQIIHIAFDDIADHKSNPFAGKIFNKPTAKGTPGVDVYAGCKIHYKGQDATAANLLKVLKGDKSAGGPVLGSDANSRVFFNFADHGGAGIVAMPVGGRLYATHLNDAVKYMHKNQMYKEMTMYVEACESGSMFKNILDENIDVYAITASNEEECSWATYCGKDSGIDGTLLQTCLGDLFSVKWMEDSDKDEMSTESLKTQFEIVKKGTTKSHVQKFGQLAITSEPIGNFQAGSVVGAKAQGHNASSKIAVATQNEGLVNSRDVGLHYRYAMVASNPTPENHKALADEIASRMKADKVFATAFPTHKLGNTPAHIKFDCYKNLVGQFEKICFEFGDYSMKYMTVLAQQCEVIAAYPEAGHATIATLTKTCAAI